ncbi:restriction endonuclease [Lysobacter claricitrinus]|uniref:restriction endonuclease n=1 Tax=Lysobacter claricitrinus TaxID=3367728 RepID=UPI0038B29A1B
MKRVSARRSDVLAHVSWQQLESLLAEHYRSQGYQVEHCGTGRSGSRFDGGIDLKLRRSGEYVLVQAKHWNARQVPHNAVHELLGLMVNEGATGSVLVTSGEFTRAAVEAATRHGHVQLIDGEDLRTQLGGWTRMEVAPPPSYDPDARWKRGAIDASRHVGERLLSAAEDGLRTRAPARHVRNAASEYGVRFHFFSHGESGSVSFPAQLDRHAATGLVILARLSANVLGKRRRDRDPCRRVCFGLSACGMQPVQP